MFKIFRLSIEMPRYREIIDEAKQIRRQIFYSFKPWEIIFFKLEIKTVIARLKIREQQRQVSKVLLDGLYDSDSPLFMLLDVRTEVVGEIIWKVDPTRSISESQWLQLVLAIQNRISNYIICQEVVENWKMFSAQQVEQILVMSEGNDDDEDDDDDKFYGIPALFNLDE